MATPTPATVEELLAYLDKDANPPETAELLLMLEAGTEAAEGWRGVGPIVSREFTDRVATYAGCSMILPRTPVVSVTSATRVSDGLVLLEADLDVRPSGIVTGKNQSLRPGEYVVVYDAGRDPVPASLKLATLIISGHLWETQQGPTTNSFIGDAGAENNFRVGAGYLIPNRAAHLLSPFASEAVA